MADAGLTPEQGAALDALQQMLDSRLEVQGGYPAQVDGETIPGWVVVADVDHEEAPELSVYTWEQLLAWYRRALAFAELDEDGPDMVTAMYEMRHDDLDPEWAAAGLRVRVRGSVACVVAVRGCRRGRESRKCVHYSVRPAGLTTGGKPPTRFRARDPVVRPAGRLR